LRFEPLSGRILADRIGAPDEPDLLLAYTNHGSTALDILPSLTGMRLLVDDEQFQPELDRYDGPGQILPGESAAFLLSLDRFPGAEAGLKPGPHQLGVEFAGLRSRPIVVDASAW
jgi:hypothetical protein